MITATIITIGDELLIGQTIDTNSAWIAQALNDIGIQIKRRIAIADTKIDILNALKESAQLSSIVIITGGLGPTNDDITKETLCAYFTDTLVPHEPTLKHILSFFKQRNRELLDINIAQAHLPTKCVALPNPVGTAPGMAFEQNEVLYYSLPGVPFEMKHLMTHEVIPAIHKKIKLKAIIHKTLMTSGMGESFIADKLQEFEKEIPSDIRLAYLPNYGIVKLRLSGQTTMESKINELFTKLQTILSDIVINNSDEPLEQIIFNYLSKKNQTIAIAESCTGGNVASKLVSISGASTIFRGGIVAYTDDTKINVLGVAKELIGQQTAVSEKTALAMAQKSKERFNATIGIATTGYLEGNEKYFFAAFAGPNNTYVKRFNLRYNRKLNSTLAVSITLQFIIKALQKNKTAKELP